MHCITDSGRHKQLASSRVSASSVGHCYLHCGYVMLEDWSWTEKHHREEVIQTRTLLSTRYITPPKILLLSKHCASPEPSRCSRCAPPNAFYSSYLCPLSPRLDLTHSFTWKDEPGFRAVIANLRAHTPRPWLLLESDALASSDPRHPFVDASARLDTSGTRHRHPDQTSHPRAGPLFNTTLQAVSLLGVDLFSDRKRRSRDLISASRPTLHHHRRLESRPFWEEFRSPAAGR